MSVGNNAETHGYRWSDGTTRQHPEPKLAKALNDIAKLPPTEKSKPLPVVTQEVYDRAYAEWVREFTAWQAKYGSKA